MSSPCANVVYNTSAGFCPEDWDDTLIMDVYKSTIQSFGTSDKSLNTFKRKRKQKFSESNNPSKILVTKEEMLSQAKAGDWKPVKLRLNIDKPEPGEVIEDDRDDTNLFLNGYNETESENPQVGMNALLQPKIKAISNSIPTTSSEDNVSEAIDTAFNEMLTLWYQTGYATGRYQTLLELQKQNGNQK